MHIFSYSLSLYLICGTIIAIYALSQKHVSKDREGSIPLIARFMGPTWGPSGADRTQVDPMLAPWTLLSGSLMISTVTIVFLFNCHICPVILIIWAVSYGIGLVLCNNLVSGRGGAGWRKRDVLWLTNQANRWMHFSARFMSVNGLKLLMIAFS